MMLGNRPAPDTDGEQNDDGGELDGDRPGAARRKKYGEARRGAKRPWRDGYVADVPARGDEHTEARHHEQLAERDDARARDVIVDRPAIRGDQHRDEREAERQER